MKGSIILNGNIKFEPDYIHEFKHKILSSVHIDPEVRKNKKALLITAAWQKSEYDEEHVKKALRDIGIPSVIKDGYDVNIQNLGIYHTFNEFKKAEPQLYCFYHEKQQNIKSIKEMYRNKNNSLVRILKEQVKKIKEEFPGTTFHDIMEYNIKDGFSSLMETDEKDLQKQRYHYYCRDIQYTLKHIRDIDYEIAAVSREIDSYFFKKSKISEIPLYQAQKQEMEERILSSNTIFIFGGNVAVLLNRLSFYQLKDTLKKALINGANFFTVSAGSDILVEKIILYGWVDLEHPEPWQDFEFFDNGFGLITKLTLFPHCVDRIKMQDPDTRSYLAYRFQGTNCVGLDQRSFLKLETYMDENDKLYERFVSVGKDEGVYLFDKSGNLHVKEYGEELNIPGSKLHENSRQEPETPRRRSTDR
jgi:hypothetical protein